MSKDKAVVKVFEYQSINVPFKLKIDDQVRNNSFKLRKRTEKVIHNGDATIVILDDGSKGIVKRYHKDEPNEKKGIQLAYLKAKIKSLVKEFNDQCGAEKIKVTGL